MTRLPDQIALVCLSGLLIPLVFIYLEAYELAFAASAIITTLWIGIIFEAWVDFGRPSSWLLASGLLMLIWPGVALPLFLLP